MILSSLREQHDYDISISEKPKDIYDFNTNPTHNTRLINALFEVLHLEFPPGNNPCPIHSFCYKEDFGRFTDITTDDLWSELKRGREINIHYKLV